jgi:hypothetical protein
MASSDAALSNLICGGSVAAGGAVTNRYGQGFTVGAQVGGVCTITLAAPGVPAGESILEVTPGAGAGGANITDTSPTVKTVTTVAQATAGVLTNEPFQFVISQIVPAP